MSEFENEEVKHLLFEKEELFKKARIHYDLSLKSSQTSIKLENKYKELILCKIQLNITRIISNLDSLECIGDDINY